MRLTGLGHASVLIETAHGSILTDPWVNPAYFGSWFPFPDNSQLDWDALGQTAYLFVSHLHHDHFDPENLRRHVRKDITVLLPDFPTSELEDSLRELGFHNFVAPASEEVVEIDGLQIMIQSLVSPTDGPIGDSSLWIYDGQQRLLNQNDARPSELSIFTELGPIDAYLVQFSGAIWYPMVYELPKRAKQALGFQKRDRQFDRTLRYIDECGARFVFPTAGPPCFLDEELWGFNDIFGDEANIFPDQSVYLSWLAERGHDEGRLLLPGTIAAVDQPDCPVIHPYDPALVFEHKEQYLREYQARKVPAVEAVKSTWAHPEIDVLAELTKWFTPLLEEAEHMARGIDGGIRFTAEDDDRGDVDFVIDFVSREVREYAGEKVRYRFRSRRAYPRAADRGARDRLGQQPVPVLPVLGAAHRAVQRVHLRLLQVPVRGAAELRRGLVHRAERRRGCRNGAAGWLGSPASLRAPQGGSDPLRARRRRCADLPDARLEVAAHRRQVPHVGWPRHSQRTGHGRPLRASRPARPGNRAQRRRRGFLIGAQR